MSTTANIKTKIQEHLQEMDNGSGVLRFKSVSTIPLLDSQSLSPYAEIFFGSGEFNSDINGSLDYPLTMVIRVTFDTESLASTIWEELVTLWFDSTLFNELSALGVLRIHPLDAITPVVLPGGDRYIMDVHYLLEIRLQY